MSCEETKEFLNSYRRVCKRIVVLNEQLEALREVEQSAKIQQLSDMPKGSSRDSDISDVLVKLERQQDKIDDKIVESFRIRLKIETLVTDMEDPTEGELIRKRYIEFKKWENICVDLNYSWKQIHRIHGSALEHIRIKQDDIE